MKKLLLIVVAVLLAGCGNGSQEVGEGLYRSYDKENGVGFYLAWLKKIELLGDGK